MRQKTFVSFLIFAWVFFFSSLARVHSYTVSVVVDTDMAVDDMRLMGAYRNKENKP